MAPKAKTPRVIRQITTTGDLFGLDEVFDKFETAFRPAVDDSENFYEQVAKAEIAKAAGTAAAS